MGSTIFLGDKVATLKDTLAIGNDDSSAPRILNRDIDPRVTATDATPGSLLIRRSTREIFKKLDTGSSTNWEELGSGGQAGINYVDNPDIEVDTTGYATYDDGAAATPVDGTGGSPSTLTLSRTTTSGEVLRGSGSLELSKSAADGQGEGLGYELLDFDPQDSDESKQIVISFDYRTTANYVNGDIEVFIYDMDGAALVPVQNGEILGTGGDKSKHIARFHTVAGNNSYRLIWHITSTNASAYDLQMDNFSVGPEELLPASIHEYLGELTTTGTWSTNTTYTGNYWRDGRFLVGQVTIDLAGAPTSADLDIDLPNSLTFDTNLIAADGTSDVGVIDSEVVIVNAGTGRFRGNCHVDVTDTNTIQIRYNGVSGGFVNNGRVDQATPFTFASGDQVQIWYKIPIDGWTEGALISTSQALQENIVEKVYLGSNQSVGTGTTGVRIDFDTLELGTASDWNLTTGQYTVRVPGKYNVYGQVWWEAYATDNPLGGEIYVNSTLRAETRDGRGSGNQRNTSKCQAILQLDVGDVVEFRAYHGRGSSANAQGVQEESYFQIQKINDLSIYGIFGQTELVSDDSAGLEAYPITVDQWGDLTSISLTPGEWDLDAQALHEAVGGAITTSKVHLGISTTTGNSATGLVKGDSQMIAEPATASGENTPLNLSLRGITVTSTTTYYLKGRAETSLTNLEVAWKITARRIK